MKCWSCGSHDNEPSYDWVPYGSTDVKMQTGWQCTNCGEEVGEEEEE